MNPWLNLAIRSVVIVGGCFGLSLCMNSAYANPSDKTIKNIVLIDLNHATTQADNAYALPVQPHAGLILADQISLAHTPRLHAVFLCVPFSYARSTVGLRGDTFACASNLVNWSANPSQSYHPNHLAVIDKTNKPLGVITHD